MKRVNEFGISGEDMDAPCEEAPTVEQTCDAESKKELKEDGEEAKGEEAPKKTNEEKKID